MATETRYHRSDQHTINGLSAYQLKTSNSSSVVYSDLGGLFIDPVCYWRSDVYVRHSNGNEDLIGSDVAEVSRNGDGEGYQSNTWNCPETNLATTDALKIVEKIVIESESVTRSFITEQLGATKLEASTWTFIRYTYIVINESPYPPEMEVEARLYHGDASHATRIEGIEWISYQDIGIRVQTDSGVIKIGVMDLESSHKLRIRKGNTTYGIPLLDVTDSNASPIRIYDGSNVKALPKID